MTRESSRAASRIIERESRFIQPGRNVIAASSNGRPSKPDVLPVQTGLSIPYRGAKVPYAESQRWSDGQPMKALALITDPPQVLTILRHLVKATTRPGRRVAELIPRTSLHPRDQSFLPLALPRTPQPISREGRPWQAPELQTAHSFG